MSSAHGTFDFFPPRALNESFAGWSILGSKFLLFITWNTLCHSLLAGRICAERSAVILNRVCLYVICCFSLVALNIFSLNLIFVSLISMCLAVFLLGFILYNSVYVVLLILYGIVCVASTWVSVSFPIFGKFLVIISSNISSGPFSLSSPSATPMLQMLVHLMLSQRSLWLSSVF